MVNSDMAGEDQGISDCSGPVILLENLLGLS